MTEMDEYEQGKQDFLDTVSGVNPDGRLDPAKGERYVEGWREAERTHNGLREGRPIDEHAKAYFKAKEAE